MEVLRERVLPLNLQGVGVKGAVFIKKLTHFFD